jgi:L-ascorbate metabolism protein UlaG (beta-lactamase superfamily)
VGRAGGAPGAPVVAIFELATYFQGKGLKDTIGMNIGGAVDVKGLRIAMTPALHSSGIMEDGNSIYLGEPAGFVVRLEDNRSFYFAGDTALFGDMRLIREQYAPEIAFLPIGDHFTMGPEAAARATEMLGVRQVVPMHYGTFPLLTGTPAALKKLVEPRGVDVLVLKPGETAQ